MDVDDDANGAGAGGKLPGVGEFVIIRRVAGTGCESRDVTCENWQG